MIVGGLLAASDRRYRSASKAREAVDAAEGLTPAGSRA